MKGREGDVFNNKSDDSSEQKDFFSELIQNTDGSPASSSPHAEKRPFTITINMDKVLVFVLTCAIVFAVVFFYGIETGKRISGNKPEDQEGESLLPKTTAISDRLVVYDVPEGGGGAVPVSEKGAVPVPQEQEKAVTKEVLTLEKPAEQQAQAAPDSAAAFWTVQIVTYVNKAYAAEEVGKIQKREFDAFVLPSGKYLQVCVGRFNDKQEALKVMEKFKRQKDYADAYVRYLDADRVRRIEKP